MTSMSLRHHPVRFVSVCLLLGVATAIGLAWVIAWRNQSPPTFGPTYGKRRAIEAERDPFPLKWYVNLSTRWGMSEKLFLVDTGSQLTSQDEAGFQSIASDSASLAALRRHAFLFEGTNADSVNFRVTAFGWPSRCLAYERAYTAEDASLDDLLGADLGSASRPPGATNNLAEQYGVWRVRGKCLPVNPIWSGLLQCTITFAALWAIPLAAFTCIRRRRKHGCCRVCCYKLEGLPQGAPCPECGTSEAALTR
jgi:hypothetical protein